MKHMQCLFIFSYQLWLSNSFLEDTIFWWQDSLPWRSVCFEQKSIVKVSIIRSLVNNEPELPRNPDWERSQTLTSCITSRTANSSAAVICLLLCYRTTPIYRFPNFNVSFTECDAVSEYIYKKKGKFKQIVTWLMFCMHATEGQQL